MAHSSNFLWKPLHVSPAPELTNLRRFFFDKGIANGIVKADMMGPGSPEMRAVGRWTGGPIMDGLWLVGDYQQDQFKDDTLTSWSASQATQRSQPPSRW